MRTANTEEETLEEPIPRKETLRHQRSLHGSKNGRWKDHMAAGQSSIGPRDGKITTQTPQPMD